MNSDSAVVERKTSASALDNTKTDLATTLAQWQEQEAAVRARLSHPGVARPEQVTGKTGLEVFDAIFSGGLPYPPISETMDFIPVEMQHGRANRESLARTLL